jgi:hypothetical protein
MCTKIIGIFFKNHQKTVSNFILFPAIGRSAGVEFKEI